MESKGVGQILMLSVNWTDNGECDVILGRVCVTVGGVVKLFVLCIYILLVQCLSVYIFVSVLCLLLFNCVNCVF
jgi:hypothetical protein